MIQKHIIPFTQSLRIAEENPNNDLETNAKIMKQHSLILNPHKSAMLLFRNRKIEDSWNIFHKPFKKLYVKVSFYPNYLIKTAQLAYNEHRLYVK